jgi:hypothetical protein
VLRRRWLTTEPKAAKSLLDQRTVSASPPSDRPRICMIRLLDMTFRHFSLWDTMSDLSRSMGTTDCKPLAEAPDHSELPLMCLIYGMEEAANHTLLEGKYVKVACVHKSAPQIIQ